MRASSAFTFAASVSSALAQYKGFNYGSTAVDGSAFILSDFESQFNTAKGLVGTSGFSSARVYTMIQGGTSDTVISAIPAAINTQTSILLGLWGSGGAAGFASELTALKNAISQYGSQLAPLLVGISVGSEDLYRISSVGVQAGSTDPGAEPATLVSYIQQVRDAIANTALSGASIGHVDTWTSWVNSTNSDVVSACDWIGMDAYPYFQNTQTNPIGDGASLFSSALSQTTSYAQGKPVWVTETGWPVSGPTENQAVPSIDNAKTYWDDVGCDLLFGKVNTWWYTLQDYGSSPSFGVVGQTLSTTPLYDLSCNASSSSSSSASSSATSAVSTAASATVPTTAPASATSSVVESPVPGPSLDTPSSAASGSAATTAASGSAASGSAAITAASGSGSGSASASAVTGYGSGVSTTVSAVTTGSTTSVASGGKTMTIYQTTLITITSCPTACPTTMSTASGTVPASASASASSAKSSSATASSASASSSSCAADLNGSYQYPHLIVPVSSSSPNTAYGTQYNATVNSTVSTIFNFDIPASYAGKTCSLVFLFPEQSQLETSAYTFNNAGGLVSHVLSSTANASTTYANQPSAALENGSISSLKSGNSYVISTDSCPANTAVSFELSSTGGLALEFFEDYNPSPLGLYVRAC